VALVQPITCVVYVRKAWLSVIGIGGLEGLLKLFVQIFTTKSINKLISTFLAKCVAVVEYCPKSKHKT